MFFIDEHTNIYKLMSQNASNFFKAEKYLIYCFYKLEMML